MTLLLHWCGTVLLHTFAGFLVTRQVHQQDQRQFSRQIAHATHGNDMQLWQTSYALDTSSQFTQQVLDFLIITSVSGITPHNNGSIHQNGSKGRSCGNQRLHIVQTTLNFWSITTKIRITPWNYTSIITNGGKSSQGSLDLLDMLELFLYRAAVPTCFLISPSHNGPIWSNSSKCTRRCGLDLLHLLQLINNFTSNGNQSTKKCPKLVATFDCFMSSWPFPTFDSNKIHISSCWSDHKCPPMMWLDAKLLVFPPNSWSPHATTNPSRLSAAKEIAVAWSCCTWSDDQWNWLHYSSR